MKEIKIKRWCRRCHNYWMSDNPTAKICHKCNKGTGYKPHPNEEKCKCAFCNAKRKRLTKLENKSISFVAKGKHYKITGRR